MTKLKIALCEKGIKQIQMAYDTQMNPSHLNRIINGWITPSEELKSKIAAYLDCSCEELWAPSPQQTEKASKRA